MAKMHASCCILQKFLKGGRHHEENRYRFMMGKGSPSN